MTRMTAKQIWISTGLAMVLVFGAWVQTTVAGEACCPAEEAKVKQAADKAGSLPEGHPR